jgi:hypothetical protein
MFPTVAVFNHVQDDDENDRFYAQAELILVQDASHAQLELKNVGSSVHATVLMSAKAGRNAFDISGNGTSPSNQVTRLRLPVSKKAKFPKVQSITSQIEIYPTAIAFSELACEDQSRHA